MKRQEEFNMPEKEEIANLPNLHKLEKIIEDAIEGCLRMNKKTAQVSIPANPDEDNGSRIFLITENRKSFDVHYDSKILELLKEAGYEVNASNRRDSMSGVLHYTIQVNLK